MLLGVDLGASKIRVGAYAEKGRLIAKAAGVGGNILDLGAEKVALQVVKVISQVVSNKDKISLLAVGAAGCGREEQAENLKDKLSRAQLAPEIFVFADGYSALYAAWQGEAGAVALAGTGSIAYARNQEGEIFGSGGIGPLLGDEGGGCRMVMEAISLALKEHDRWGKRRMLDWLFDKLDLKNSEELLSLVYSSPLPRKRLASAAPLLLAKAEAGSHPEGKIVLEQLKEFSYDILNVLAQLSPEQRQVVISGGLANNLYYTSLLRKFLQRGDRWLKIKVEAGLDQCHGALLYALEKSEQFSEQTLNNFI